MDIRDARIDDAREIAVVHVASERVAYGRISQDTALDIAETEKQEIAWRERIARGESRTVVAVRDGRMSGWINFGATRDSDSLGTTAEIRAMYISPEQWRMGVGTALWNFVKVSLRTSYTDVTLWVLESNHMARAFYEKVGFGCEAKAEKLVNRDGKTFRAVRYRQVLR